ncbi:2-hydroxyglutaryl-CoA dehydratase [Clostridium chromiireducens]|uniref:2-hydroxyglutaryl-CoA dehydratase n=1 Tax=Clostridium chromiireducens TaxID=225345 RepID=A0A964RSN4_9CLOT|nr:acyl-CoA dehydratase activase [Clostridium chromiireducens]MVX67047.1 2-hydroxyglutaryl-CoA dehydratase [Clostridium chromiireducens]
MYYLGVDVGSVSTDIVLLNRTFDVVEKLYLRTKGKPINAIQEGFKILKEKYHDEQIEAVGTTGSGRHISSSVLGADAVKNEITAHACAALAIDEDVRTILEIGGQDSKIIILKNGVAIDFAMNNVCAAGTGSFLDRQAERLGIPIEDFGDYALKSTTPLRIAGRCAVFAESDMIHKQQLGYNECDIINGLCEALVRNYLNDIGKGKEICPKIFFQGGVAANKGMKSCFENALGCEVYVPEHYNVMGAIGAAIIAKETVAKTGVTNFRGFDIAESKFISNSFECEGCSNRCEVVRIKNGDSIIGCFGDRCGKWTSTMTENVGRGA